MKASYESSETSKLELFDGLSGHSRKKFSPKVPPEIFERVLYNSNSYLDKFNPTPSNY